MSTKRPRRAAHFGGLIASGWHTGAMMMRMLTEVSCRRPPTSPRPARRIALAMPVRPGDVLSLRVTVLEARRSRSNPDQGVVKSLVEVINQNGEVVMSLKPIGLMRCRP